MATLPPPYPAYPPHQYPAYDPRPLLDRAIDDMRRHDDRPWGAGPAVIPLVTLAGLIVVGSVIGHFLQPSAFTARVAVGIALTVGLYIVLGFAVRLAGREVVVRYGGWGNAFGLRRPMWWDFRWIAAGAGMVLASRIVIGIIAAAVTHGRASKESQNLELHTRSVLAYVVIGLVVVVLAPVIEEIVFRGLLLRSFMRRVSFWPAALASSAVFALFHTYEVATLAGAIVLAAVTFALGVSNCLLVRWSERLTPGIAVHMLFNGLALTVLIVQNG